MADPITLAVVGATAGAVLNPNDPVKGAVFGGVLGGGAGALGAGGLVGSSAGYGALPGMTAGSQMATQLAAQSGEFGLPGLLSTGAAASTAQGINPMIGSLFDFGAKAALPSAGGMSAMQQGMVANQILGRNQQAQQRLPNAPQIQSRPFTGMKLPINAQEEEMRRRALYQMPTIQPIRLL